LVDPPDLVESHADQEDNDSVVEVGAVATGLDTASDLAITLAHTTNSRSSPP
jgi:hypothetical protein